MPIANEPLQNINILEPQEQIERDRKRERERESERLRERERERARGREREREPLEEDSALGACCLYTSEKSLPHSDRLQNHISVFGGICFMIRMSSGVVQGDLPILLCWWPKTPRDLKDAKDAERLGNLKGKLDLEFKIQRSFKNTRQPSAKNSNAMQSHQLRQNSLKELKR